MSQRLISPRIHPITGQEVKPLWFNPDGSAFYLPMGAAPDDDEGEKEPEDDSGTSGTEGQEGSDDGSDDKATKDELKKLEERMKAADRRAAAAEQKVKEFEDKDKDASTKAQERIVELESAVELKDKEIRDLRVNNAFLSANSIDWHDKTVALQNADLSEVVNEEGVVDEKALKKVLEDLAKSKPFLVKKEGEGSPPNEPSGIPAGSGSKVRKGGLSEEDLRKKYPALNR